MDKMSVVRSGDAHQRRARHGHALDDDRLRPDHRDQRQPEPELPARSSPKMRGANAPQMPRLRLPAEPAASANAAYLGVAYNPFSPGERPEQRRASRCATWSRSGRVDLDRFQDRRRLLSGLDRLRRDVDLAGRRPRATTASTATPSRSSPASAAGGAFDIHQEDPRLRDRYGRDTWGQSALLARRLVEAGVTFVTVNMGGWDTHKNNFHELKTRLLPRYDRALAALVAGPARPGPGQATCWSWPTASSAGRRGSTRTPAATTGRARCRSSSPAAA